MDSCLPIGFRFNQSTVVDIPLVCSMRAWRGLLGLAGACPFRTRWCWRQNSSASHKTVMPKIPSAADIYGFSLTNAPSSINKPRNSATPEGTQTVCEMYSIFRTDTCPIQTPIKVAVAAINPIQLRVMASHLLNFFWFVSTSRVSFHIISSDSVSSTALPATHIPVIANATFTFQFLIIA